MRTSGAPSRGSASAARCSSTWAAIHDMHRRADPLRRRETQFFGARDPMDSVGTLIVGAGMTGLATAAALTERGDDDYLVLEADREMGGWCKTVKKDGFVWDYSGH